MDGTGSETCPVGRFLTAVVRFWFLLPESYLIT